ncbi:GNAT family N-acetyltransferase [Ramlibacter sp.]|uniref:GNAT family N-acetyltransferase n=1 Tax=Ramlibacter sp. TaxID=1917967 RepID=UPI0035AF188F
MRPPQPLAAGHRLDAFTSGEPSLDAWLRQRALRNQGNGSSRTYVVCDDDDHVIAYYCLAAGAIAQADAPGNLRRNRPDPIPVIVLGRLAVHAEHHQSGLGTALLRDAILRTLQAAEVAGIAALLVHALSEPARRFYLSRGFLESPIQPMTLCLPLTTVRKTLEELDR